MIKGNRWLTLTEATENAREVYDYLAGATVENRWTSYAVCAMLGNMWTESHINPAIWEGLQEGNLKGGYGLTQWTPATKILNWLSDNGYPDDSGTGQLEKIKAEVPASPSDPVNGQWIKTTKYPYSFYEFTQWTEGESVEAMLKKLADMFMRNYERPRDLNQPNRGEMAWYFWQKLYGGEDLEPKPEPPIDPDPPVNPDPPVVSDSPLYLFKIHDWFIPSNADRRMNPIYFNKTKIINVSDSIIIVNGFKYVKMCINVYKLMKGVIT